MQNRFFYFLQHTYRRTVPTNLRLKWRAQRQRLLRVFPSKSNSLATNDFATITITKVTWHLEDNHPFLRADLQSPTTSQTVDGHVLDVYGWILEQGAPVTAVEIQQNNETFLEANLDTTRTNTNQSDGNFHATLSTLLLPEEFELQIYAKLNNGTKEKIATIAGKRSLAYKEYNPTLQPLTVIGLPRSGTTLLMNYLSNHPAIVAHKEYPFEFMALSYWLHFFRVLSTGANLAESTHPDTYLNNPYFIGHHPYFSQAIGPKLESWFQQEYSSRLLTFCLRNIDDCYQQIANSQNKKDLKYFAEKLHRPTPTYHLQWTFYPQSRSIFIVRDFRDRFCSTLSFRERIGIIHDKDDAEFIRAFITQTRKDFMLCYNLWKQNPEHIPVVRYEDLVQHPRETIAALLKQLDLEIEGKLLDKLLADTIGDTEKYTHHRTSKGDNESIGRWRTELNSEENALFQELFGDILSEFGYDV